MAKPVRRLNHAGSVRTMPQKINARLATGIHREFQGYNSTLRRKRANWLAVGTSQAATEARRNFPLATRRPRSFGRWFRSEVSNRAIATGCAPNADRF